MIDQLPDLMRGRRIFVTGATGVVGSALIHRLLDSGSELVALVRDEPALSPLVLTGDIRRVTRVNGLIEDAELIHRVLTEYDIELVFHLAAQTQVPIADREPFATLEANVRGTYGLLEAARRQARRVAIVIASSDKAYGSSTVLPYTEDHPLAGKGIYDASKSAADLLASAYAGTFALPVAVARCGNIYGEGDLNWDRLVPGTTRSLLAGTRPVLRSDGSPRRDYIYVQDAVGAYLRLGIALLKHDIESEAFNFGHNSPVSVLEVVSRLQAILDRDDLEPIIMGGASSEIADQWLDATKAQDRLDWRPEYDLDAGLRRTVEWYRGVLNT